MVTSLRSVRNQTAQPAVTYVSHTGTCGGGAEIVLQAMIKAARQGGYSPGLVCPAGDLVSCAGNECDRITLIPMPWLRRTKSPVVLPALARGWLASTWTLTRLFGTTRPDLVHANSGVAFLIVAVPAAVTGRRVIWHQHDIIPNRLVNRLVLGTAARLASAVIAT